MTFGRTPHAVCSKNPMAIECRIGLPTFNWNMFVNNTPYERWQPICNSLATICFSPPHAALG